MAILELLPLGHPVLRSVCPAFSFKESQWEPIQLAKDLTETMLSKRGIGLAAPQVGIATRVFVLWGSPVIAMFNPRIVNFSEQKVVLEEACLSVPGLTMKVERPENLRIRFQLPNAEVVTREFGGLTARTIQHELDHLNGRLFFDGASKLRLEMAIKKAARLGHNYTLTQLKENRNAICET